MEERKGKCYYNIQSQWKETQKGKNKLRKTLADERTSHANRTEKVMFWNTVYIFNTISIKIPMPLFTVWKKMLKHCIKKTESQSHLSKKSNVIGISIYDFKQNTPKVIKMHQCISIRLPQKQAG